MAVSLGARRRTLLAALALAVLLLAPGLVLPRTGARADIYFCEDDPVVAFNGVPVDITAGISQRGVHEIQGDVPIIVVVPDGVNAALISSTHKYFTETVVILHVSEARAQSDLSADHAAAAALAATNQVIVLSRFTTDGTFHTRLYSNGSSDVFQGSSNQLMWISFPLPDHGDETAAGGAAGAAR